MPVSQLSDEELEHLLSAVVTPGQVETIEALLRDCHEFKTYGSLMPYERYFHKQLAYREFDLHIRRFVGDDTSVSEADIQFKRRSTFPAPYLNRNRALRSRLRHVLDGLYPGQIVHTERDGQVRKIHYKARLTHVNFDNVLEWVGECTLIDEPHSSGLTPEEETDIRNDFVIILFKREIE